MTTYQQQMIEDMTVRGLAPATQQAYLRALTGLEAYYVHHNGRSGATSPHHRDNSKSPELVQTNAWCLCTSETEKSLCHPYRNGTKTGSI